MTESDYLHQFKAGESSRGVTHSVNEQQSIFNIFQAVAVAICCTAPLAFLHQSLNGCRFGYGQ